MLALSTPRTVVACHDADCSAGPSVVGTRARGLGAHVELGSEQRQRRRTVDLERRRELRVLVDAGTVGSNVPDDRLRVHARAAPAIRYAPSSRGRSPLTAGRVRARPHRANEIRIGVVAAEFLRRHAVHRPSTARRRRQRRENRATRTVRNAESARLASSTIATRPFTA